MKGLKPASAEEAFQAKTRSSQEKSNAILRMKLLWNLRNCCKDAQVSV